MWRNGQTPPRFWNNGSSGKALIFAFSVKPSCIDTLAQQGDRNVSEERLRCLEPYTESQTFWNIVLSYYYRLSSREVAKQTTPSLIRAAEILQELRSIRLCMADVPKHNEPIIARKTLRRISDSRWGQRRIEAPSIGRRQSVSNATRNESKPTMLNHSEEMISTMVDNVREAVGRVLMRNVRIRHICSTWFLTSLSLFVMVHLWAETIVGNIFLGSKMTERLLMCGVGGVPPRRNLPLFYL